MLDSIGNIAVFCVSVVVLLIAGLVIRSLYRWMRSFDDLEAKDMADADANKEWYGDLDTLDDKPLQNFSDAVAYSRGVASDARNRGLPENEVMALKRKAIEDYTHGRVTA